MQKKILYLIGALALLAAPAWAWSIHGLITQPVFEGQVSVKPVKVESLESFLLAVEPQLAQTLAAEDAWSRQNLAWYVPLKPYQMFTATGTASDARPRFFKAMRLNPTAKFPLYLQMLPGQASSRPALKAEDVSIFKDNAWLDGVNFVALRPGEDVSPLEIIITACDEPDMGLDVGLFTDNKPSYESDLGPQPFGNPNLEYGPQAPFHMGFYHEAPIVFKLAPFLKQSYVEMRIHQYRTLAALAFKNGHDYWGWRFTGLGLHYLADLAQPYHSTALPGVSTSKMIGMNLLDATGTHGPKNNAVQLVSNRHLALEQFERLLLEQAYQKHDVSFNQFEALRNPGATPTYTDSVPRDVIAKGSNDQARRVNRILIKDMPTRLVSDPKIEFGTSPEQNHIVEIVRAEKGESAEHELEGLMNELLRPYALYGRAYVRAVLDDAGRQ